MANIQFQTFTPTRSNILEFCQDFPMEGDIGCIKDQIAHELYLCAHQPQRLPHLKVTITTVMRDVLYENEAGRAVFGPSEKEIDKDFLELLFYASIVAVAGFAQA